MYRITGIPHGYAWGSRSAIQAFLGLPEDGKPLAEVWYGAHPSAPALVQLPADGSVPLDAFIAQDREGTLGPTLAESPGGALPFLLKLLAPGSPVSLQVHPTLENGRRGFAREEALGIPLDSPLRSFKDANHKPEMVYALTAFEGLVGFRPASAVREALTPFRSSPMRALQEAASESGNGPDEVRRTFEAALALSPAQVDEVVEEAEDLASASPAGPSNAYATVLELARSFPSDPGVVASMLLHRVVLQPGDAVFVGDGVPHAYLSGLCAEIMANSDNVLRAGLTGKHIDVAALLENADFSRTEPHILRGSADSGAVTRVSPPVAEFVLTRVAGSAEPVTLASAGPRIALAVQGRVSLEGRAGGTLDLQQGQAAFVPDSAGALTVTGPGSVVIAGVPGR